MSRQSRLLFGTALVGAALGFGQAGAAGDPAAANAASCQDQFMLDRRDDPQNALRNLHRCNAVQDIGGNMENFTFWYITLPPASQAGETASFDRSWKNNLAVLTSPGVGLPQQKAIAVLDASIARGLTRGKRENLIAGWTASHNPKVLVQAIATTTQQAAAPAASADAPVPAVAAVKPAAAPAQQARRRHPPIRRYVRVNRNHESGSATPTAGAADAVASEENGYGAAAMSYTAYVPVYAPAPYVPAGMPEPVRQAQRLSAPPAGQPVYFPPIPQVVEAPLRAAGQALRQIDQGVQSVTHALIGRPSQGHKCRSG